MKLHLRYARDNDKKINDLLSRYRRLEVIVDERIRKALSYDEQPLMHITHRIKTHASIKGKLARKPKEYPNVESLYDVLGFRVICYFQEDTDEAARLVAENFKVDWSKSKDKRALIDPTSFGYVSIHFVCALPDDDSCPEDLRNLWFEVQVRTILQHTWAEIEHDLGYKTEFGIPREIRRSFSRASSLLETTDLLFSDIRKQIADYKTQVVENIKNDCADDMFIDSVTLGEFTSESKLYRKLLSDIASITDAHISEADPDSQLEQLDFLGVEKLGDLVAMINENYDFALSLARDRLQDSELEELSSTVAYYYLYRAKLIRGDLSPERIREFFALTTSDSKSIDRNTEWILKERRIYNGEEQPL